MSRHSKYSLAELCFVAKQNLDIDNNFTSDYSLTSMVFSIRANYERFSISELEEVYRTIIELQEINRNLKKAVRKSNDTMHTANINRLRTTIAG